MALLPAGPVHEAHAVCPAVAPDRDLVDHRVGRDIEVPSGERRRQMDGGRLIVGADGAAAPARRRPETGGAIAHVLGENPLRRGIARMQACRRSSEIERLSEYRAVSRYHRYTQALRSLRDQKVADQGFRRRQQASGRGIRRILQSLVAAVHADQQLDLVVIRREVLIADGPIYA